MNLRKFSYIALMWAAAASGGQLLAQPASAGLASPTFTQLFNFAGADGQAPAGALVQAADGNLYGTTAQGGVNGGTAFKITPSGMLTTLHSFNDMHGTDGATPESGLLPTLDGNFYGTTYFGGAYGVGTVYKITPSGRVTVLHSFCSQASCPDGMGPTAPLVQGVDGKLYGETELGGAYGHGTVFQITLSGALTTLYSFCSQPNCPDGSQPEAGLVQGTDGNFYGTTYSGGGFCNDEGGCGTAFKITPSGKLTTLHRFCSQRSCADGAVPVGGLLQGANGTFYGTTIGYVAYFAYYNYGTIFEITPEGKLTTLYSFCSQPNCPDGSYPAAGLMQASDGNFYGTTSGFNELVATCGTIFRITPAGVLTTLYNLCSEGGMCGLIPWAKVVQASDGKLYGTTQIGGTGYDGTVFSLDVGLGPILKTLPHSGHVGSVVQIFGSDLTGASSVSFNGTSAVFTVVSPTEISTTVPGGATTGKVEVTLPGGPLSSDGPFIVLP